MPKLAEIKQPKNTERFGHCHTATLVAEGVVGSTTDAEGWHALCKGVVVDGRGRVHKCVCECHAGETRCVDCGELHADLDELNDEAGYRVRCIDREQCAQRLIARVEANPSWKMWEAVDERVKQELAETQPAKQEAARERRETTKEPKRCHHCGEMTKGGNFVMGHDMKLKGTLLRAAREGDERALAEFMERGWFKDAKTHKVPQEVADAAQAMDGANSGPWLRQRVEDRLRMIDAGVDPEEAVKTQ